MKEFVDNLNRHLESEYKLSGLISHKVTKGTKREEIMKSVIKDLLPDIFIFGDGEIINPSGIKSKQQDLILSSKYLSILKASEISLYPVDSVIATVGIKSKLTLTTLKEDFQNIKSVKDIKKTIPTNVSNGSWNEQVQSNIFAFEGDSLEKMQENIEKIKAELKLEKMQMFDNLCVLNKYLITNNSQLRRFFGKEDEQYVYLNLEDKSFIFFLDCMLNEMSIPLSPVPIFAKYLGSFDAKCLK